MHICAPCTNVHTQHTCTHVHKHHTCTHVHKQHTCTRCTHNTCTHVHTRHTHAPFCTRWQVPSCLRICRPNTCSKSRNEHQSDICATQTQDAACAVLCVPWSSLCSGALVKLVLGQTWQTWNGGEHSQARSRFPLEQTSWQWIQEPSKICMCVYVCIVYVYVCVYVRVGVYVYLHLCVYECLFSTQRLRQFVSQLAHISVTKENAAAAVSMRWIVCIYACLHVFTCVCMHACIW